ncbi:MAG TPA: alkaline phosphatase family protein [Blastocatellia bacterium]|nr:alkaline phosphatase family protein [Blastocatellia bacterium]
MRRIVTFLFPFLLVASLSGSASSRRRSPIETFPAKDRLVIVISLDGFPAYTFADPTLPAPTLRRLASEGVMAEGMRISNPAVTWPNHTSMVTGVQPEKHGVLYNGMLVRGGPRVAPKIEPWRDKREMVRVPTVYDLAYQAGLTTAQVDWVAIQNPGTINWEFAERPRADGAVEKEMIAEGLLTENEAREFSKGNITWRDQVWTNAAIHIIKKHRPNLLLFHLLNLDSVHHRYGPRTVAGYTAQAYIDTRVGQLFDALKAANLLDRTTVLVVSDHGFKTAKRSIKANAVLRRMGLLQAEGSKVSGDAYVISEGGTAMAYINAPENRKRLAPQMKEAFLATEGVARVMEPSEFHSLGMPTPEENDQMADLILVAKDGYSFGNPVDGDAVVDITGGMSPGSHGYVSSDPEMNAIFIAWGYGIQGGRRLGMIDNVDVAPTIAALLGLRMEGITGKPLVTILKLSDTVNTR